MRGGLFKGILGASSNSRAPKPFPCAGREAEAEMLITLCPTKPDQDWPVSGEHNDLAARQAFSPAFCDSTGSCNSDIHKIGTFILKTPRVASSSQHHVPGPFTNTKLSKPPFYLNTQALLSHPELL